MNLNELLIELSAKTVGYEADLALAFHLMPDDGLCCEFGVMEGRTFRPFAEALAPRKLYGFDWFQGLPETWAPVMAPKGSMACAIPTDLPVNTELVIGLFQDTLEPFLRTHDGPVAFCHFDADLYSSTKYVLGKVGPRLADGAILIFDEIIGSPYAHAHEGRAFVEWLVTRPATPTDLIGMRHRNAAIFQINKPA